MFFCFFELSDELWLYANGVIIAFEIEEGNDLCYKKGVINGVMS